MLALQDEVAKQKSRIDAVQLTCCPTNNQPHMSNETTTTPPLAEAPSATASTVTLGKAPMSLAPLQPGMAAEKSRQQRQRLQIIAQRSRASKRPDGHMHSADVASGSH